MTAGRFADGPVSVRVPATSANLGPGFDALGLALTLYDDVTARVTGDGLSIEVTGEGADGVARDESHLVVRAMQRAFDVLGAPPPGLAVHCVNRIPHGRGLGSSAAAITAGLVLARALVTGGADSLPDTDLLALAAEIEGHPDNVAPCLLGGCTVAWTDGGRAAALRVEIADTIRPVLLIPSFASSTAQARGLLPEAVPHRDATHNASRAALLVAALSAAPQLLLEATEDRLHQPYRAAAIGPSAQLMTRLRAAGHAAVISGAGPSVLVLARDEREAEAIPAADGWRREALAVERRRLRVTRP
jgi:homoserine kinase